MLLQVDRQRVVERWPISPSALQPILALAVFKSAEAKPRRLRFLQTQPRCQFFDGLQPCAAVTVLNERDPDG